MITYKHAKARDPERRHRRDIRPSHIYTPRQYRSSEPLQELGITAMCWVLAAPLLWLAYGMATKGVWPAFLVISPLPLLLLVTPLWRARQRRRIREIADGEREGRTEQEASRAAQSRERFNARVQTFLMVLPLSLGVPLFLMEAPSSSGHGLLIFGFYVYVGFLALFGLKHVLRHRMEDRFARNALQDTPPLLSDNTRTVGWMYAGWVGSIALVIVLGGIWMSLSTFGSLGFTAILGPIMLLSAYLPTRDWIQASRIRSFDVAEEMTTPRAVLEEEPVTFEHPTSIEAEETLSEEAPAYAP